ncbi:MAG TPA: OmpA family protein [Elusimicrobiales bacterium]|nr:OmpA family protein [Elusimicrobiales bacterium]
MAKRPIVTLALLLTAALFVGACSKQSKQTPKSSFITAPDGRKIPSSTPSSGIATDGGLEELTSTDTISSANTTIIAPVGEDGALEEANVRGGEFASQQGLETLYFDFDSYGLGPAEQAKASKNADLIKARAGQDTLVEGHCDQRGTIEYNIALGQKRAREVRDYYVRLGVAAKKLTTISYGKEKPVCAESAETCWSRNRRAETKARPAQN